MRANSDLARHCRVGGSWRLVKAGHILSTNAVKVPHASQVSQYDIDIESAREETAQAQTPSLSAMLKLSQTRQNEQTHLETKSRVFIATAAILVPYPVTLICRSILECDRSVV